MRMSRWVRIATVTALLGGVAFAASFLTFIHHVEHLAPPASLSARHMQADGIVVLTGGDRRLTEGMRLLEQGSAKRLLVSGVHPDTSREMLRRAHNLHPRRLLSCCTDLGYEAGDTVGNASEARDWVRRNGYASLVVVTANYHMPRSLAELGHAMPGVRLIAHPVDPRPAGSSPWWSDASLLRVLGREYIKYARCTARMQIGHLRQIARDTLTDLADKRTATRTAEPLGPY